MEAPAIVSGRWTRVRTLGRGASGAEVYLAADEASGELFAVKSAAGGAAVEALRRERRVMSGLRSPHVVACIGGRAGRDGSYQLFLEFAPGGSLADAVVGGRLEDGAALPGYAADVARGLAYLHGESVVHGDVKARNVVIGADGRARLVDFGCARRVGSKGPIGGTPAFMAPEVARGQEQGHAADVWALGCTVIEMATGRTPWGDVVGDDVLAALRLIGHTDAVPEVPPWLSVEAKDFLDKCLRRDASVRWTAAQLLEHPFIASAGSDAHAAPEAAAAAKGKWVSPKSTLDAAFWEESSDTDDEDDGASSQRSTAERISALACSVSSLPDWDSDSDEGWIDVMIFTPTSEASDAATELAEATTAGIDGGVRSEAEANAEAEALDIDGDSGDSAHIAGETDASPEHQEHPHLNFDLACDDEVPCKLQSDTNHAVNFVVAQIWLCLSKFLNLDALCSFRSPPLLFLAHVNALVTC